ncbi:MAG: succinoglycan biosynthesis transport protein ExoP [Alphaproteobacteria bacterium]
MPDYSLCCDQIALFPPFDYGPKQRNLPSKTSATLSLKMQGRRQWESNIADNSDGQLVPVEDAQAPANQGLRFSHGDRHERFSSEPDLGQTLRRYSRLLLKHKWLYLGSCLLCLAAAGIYTATRTSLYSATVRIQIDRASQEILKHNTTAALETSASDYLRTQYALLGSRSMAERVVIHLSLEQDAKFFEPRRVTLAGMVKSLSTNRKPNNKRSLEQLQSSAASIVNSNVAIRPLPGSRLIDIRYKDPSPIRAQRIANAYAAAYIASNIDRRLATNDYTRTFLNQQIKQLRNRLETSEKELLRFAKQEKIIATSDQTSAAEDNLSAANTALGKLISERIRNQELWQQVKNATSIQMPQFLSNTVIDQLRGQRKALMNEYQEKLETYKPGYPAMRQIRNKINEINRQLTSEAKTIRASFKAAYKNSASQEKHMRAQIELLRTEVLSLKNKQIRYNILKREADSNRSLYNDLLKRFKEVDVAGSARANNVFVVDRARIPSTLSEPRLTRSLLLALLLGLSTSTLLAYTIEILDDRIYSPAEAEQLTGLVTIGTIPKADNGLEAGLDTPHPRSIIAEAHRTLATALQFATHSGLPRSITITSSSAGEGKTTTALALARHFAMLGLKVLLVDGNLHNPSLHSRLQAENVVGFSCYLTGALKPVDVIQRTDMPNLSFIASGPPRPYAADLLAGTQFQALIAAGLEVFDLIVVDGPPVLGQADAALLSNAVSATLFVVAHGNQRRGVIGDAIHQLHIAQAPLAGTVFTHYDGRRERLK